MHDSKPKPPLRPVSNLASAALKKSIPSTVRWQQAMRSIDARLDLAEKRIDAVLERQASKRG